MLYSISKNGKALWSVDLLSLRTVLLVSKLFLFPAIPTKQSVIVGGSVAVINQYPSVVALLYSTNGNNFNQACVGSIVTTKAILTAAHCVL